MADQVNSSTARARVRYTLTEIVTGSQWPVTPELKLVGHGTVCLSPYLQCY